MSVCVAAAGSKDQQRLVVGVMCPHRFVVLGFNSRELFSCPLSLLFAISQACPYEEQLFVQAPLFYTYSLASLTGFGCIIPSVSFTFVTQRPSICVQRDKYIYPDKELTALLNLAQGTHPS